MLVNSSKGYHTSYEDFHNKNKMEKRPTLLGFFHWTVDGKFVNNFMMAYFFLLELTFADQVNHKTAPNTKTHKHFLAHGTCHMANLKHSVVR